MLSLHFGKQVHVACSPACLQLAIAHARIDSINAYTQTEWLALTLHCSHITDNDVLHSRRQRL